MGDAGGFDAFVAALDYPMFVATATVPGTGEPVGCLVGFATQCSIDPPRFLICLSKRNHTYRAGRDAGILAVHALSAGQRDLAVLFGAETGDEVDKFSRCRWHPGPEGVPLLADCPYWVVARVLDRVDLGDHVGFVLGDSLGGGQAAGRRPDLLMFSATRDLEAGHDA